MIGLPIDIAEIKRNAYKQRKARRRGTLKGPESDSEAWARLVIPVGFFARVGPTEKQIEVLRRARPKEYAAREQALAEGRTLPIARFYYRCRAWDPTTRLCTQYDTRPRTCSEYPYGKACDEMACSWTNAKVATDPKRGRCLSPNEAALVGEGRRHVSTLSIGRKASGLEAKKPCR